MAERLFREAAGERHQARSAGSEPGTQAHPQVIQALQEIGIDASDHRRINWDVPDPKNLPIEQVRPIRDEIRRRVADLVEHLDAAAVPA
jgi:arsenate reductase (thioredoxin)